MSNKLSMGISGKKEDTSKVQGLPYCGSTQLKMVFDNICSEYVANSWEKVDNRVHFQVTCFQSTPSQKVYSTRSILLKFIKNFETHAYSSEQNSDERMNKTISTLWKAFRSYKPSSITKWIRFMQFFYRTVMTLEAIYKFFITTISSRSASTLF